MHEDADMKVATGREFFTQFGDIAAGIVPDLRWALIDRAGSWTEPPDDCDLAVWAGDAYYVDAFVETAIQLPALRWVHTEDAGTDGPFYDAMRERAVMLTHSPAANAPEVAEFALALILWATKRLDALGQQQRGHQWRVLPLEALSDKTLLVIGLGAIGARIAGYAKAFGMRVLGIRRSPKPVAKVDRLGTMADLHEFLPQADFVALALPYSPDLIGFINQDAINRMKPGATLINVARGALVDTKALVEALAAGQIRQACLDVLPTEPLPADAPLWDTPNLFITPHNAYNSPLYLIRVGELWLENLKRYVQGEPLLHRAF